MLEARQIGNGRRSLTGMMTSAKKTPGLGKFESSLERDLFFLLEFDRRVIAWYPQPVTLPVPAEPGRRASRYTPDVSIEYAAEPDGQIVDRVELCEVKYREELRTDWIKLKPRLRTGVRHARENGWSFRIYTEVEIRTPRLANAKYFLPYVSRQVDENHVMRLEQALSRFGVSTPNEVLDAAQQREGERGWMLGVLWHLIAVGRIEMDFDKALTMQSSIRCRGHVTER